MLDDRNQKGSAPQSNAGLRPLDGSPRTGEGKKETFAVNAFQLSFPKGGGAIRGIGEKFGANPVTGTGSMTIPLAVSPGRSGFGPQLSLSYDSGSGNGPFGLGWNLSLPAITRKTDKGLPRYFDAGESDVFILSGAEDLVPELEQSNGKWQPKNILPQTIGTYTYNIRRYRPRTEGSFARIERWTRNDGDIHWRSISKDNILTIYGQDENSRIADPQDKQRVFSWLISETRDDKGNGIVYEYAQENAIGIELTQANENNRGYLESDLRKANRYIKCIKYGNHQPLLDNLGKRPPFLSAAQRADATWLLEVVFDYGEHDANNPTPDDEGEWICRLDPFSTYRSGFEVRTYRLCRRVLMFHRFAELGATPYLVRSTDFKFHQTPVSSFITSVTQSGYVRQSDGTYLKKSLPPVEFKYSEAVIENEIRELEDAESLENLPYGLDGTNYQWIDLDGDGAAGILTEQANTWFYKRNLSTRAKENRDKEC